MEVLQISSNQNASSHHEVVFGTWCGGEGDEPSAEHQGGGSGLECTYEVALDASSPLASKHDAAAALPPQQRKKLVSIMKKIFSGRKRNYSRSAAGKDVVFDVVLNKGSSNDDDASVASTACSTISNSSLFDDNDSIETVPTSNTTTDRMLKQTTILDLLRVLVELNESNDTKEDPSDTSSSNIEISLPLEDEPLIQTRLFETGLIESTKDFSFTTDKVSKEVQHLYEQAENESERNVTHVKTGIWQVICYDEMDGSPLDPFYIVTGVSMDDRVDTKKLRQAIFAGSKKSYKKRPKVQLAPKPIAEELAGFKSGTIAPILHSSNMKLYLEETVANTADGHELAMGSGMFGKCLSLKTQKFLGIARANPKGMEAVPLIQVKKNKKKNQPETKLGPKSILKKRTSRTTRNHQRRVQWQLPSPRDRLGSF